MTDRDDDPAERFIARVVEEVPGVSEVDPAGSSWAVAGSDIEPTPAQCADPAERVRLWREHGVRWVHGESAA